MRSISLVFIAIFVVMMSAQAIKNETTRILFLLITPRLLPFLRLIKLRTQTTCPPLKRE